MALFQRGEGARFTGKTDPVMEKFNNSLNVDRVMWMADIDGSIAYSQCIEAAKQDIMRYMDSARARTMLCNDDEPVAGYPFTNMVMWHASGVEFTLLLMNNLKRIVLETRSKRDARKIALRMNEASQLYRAAGLSPNNIIVSGALYALEFLCPEAAPAA